MNELTQRTAWAAPSSGSWGALRAVFQRDLRIALRRRADTGSALVFFVIVAALFPLGVGPEFGLLRRMGPGVVWVAALLASMLALGRLFADDHADGTLEQMLLSPTALALLVLAKTAAHWLASGLLLVLISPLLALQFDLGREAAGVLFLSLLLGTPLLSLIGAIGAALTVGLRGAGVLLSLLVLPLCAPVLIFGAGAVEASMAGLGVAAHFSLLGAMLLLALFLAPLAAAAALRIALE
jgi:heme exporter protein B